MENVCKICGKPILEPSPVMIVVDVENQWHEACRDPRIEQRAGAAKADLNKPVETSTVSTLFPGQNRVRH